MTLYVRGSWQGMVNVESPLMAPGHRGMMVEVRAYPTPTSGLDLSAELLIDGARFGPFFERIWTPNDLADIYELTHHQLHGYDPRGLDPREGPTRLRQR